MQANHPLIVGLTGSIGSGKTLIAQVFQHLGIEVYFSDTEAKKLYQKAEVIQKIKDLFGPQVFTNNLLDKQKLANLVFTNKNELNKLNALIHPLVQEDFEDWTTKQKSPYVIMESAIIFETKWNTLFDKIINVSTPINLIIERVEKRDNTTKERIYERMNNQFSIEEKNRLSDYIIINDNIKLCLPQIRKIHADLLSLANKSSNPLNNIQTK